MQTELAESDPLVSPRALPPCEDGHKHAVQFYESEPDLINELAHFIGAGMRQDDDYCLVIATAPHRAQLAQRLIDDGIEAAALTDRYLALDAFETLACCLRDGRPDPACFEETIEPLIAGPLRAGRPIRVFGEMVALLAATDHQAAIALEGLWNAFQEKHHFLLLCAYPVDQIDGPDGAGLIQDVIAAHDSVLPAESYTTLATETERLSAIVMWQQKARWLSAEIERRQQVEAALTETLAAERTARAAAEAALHARDDFLSIAAHELRTPLTGLSAQVQLQRRRLSRGCEIESDRWATTLDGLARQTNKITNLIDRVLDVSRVNGGNLNLDRRPANLTELVSSTVAFWAGTSEATTIRLTADPGVFILADEIRLEQILGNLLDNAIKYGDPDGEIDVSLTVITPDQVELVVRDHGPGIPPAARGHIFEQFYRAGNDDAKRGLGLGLFITRQIVELHGGTICAEFPPSGGTRFAVRLPTIPQPVDQ